MIAVSLAADEAAGSHALYRLAGEDVALAGGWPELDPFRRGAEAPRFESRRCPEAPFDDLRYRGPTRIGEDDAPLLTCALGEAGYLLRASPGATLWVAGDGSRITQCTSRDASDERPSAELLFGPALLLALALRGTYALHASAVRWGERAIAFVGPSGAGKSTLAALLAAADPTCERVADDILPFVAQDGIAQARPGFPQLKLGAAEQWNGGRPESLPLAAVYRLGPLAGGATEAPRIETLLGAEALAVLTAHSVATALFGAELLRRHFDSLAAIGGALRIADLRFPRRLDVGPQVRELLREDLDA